MQAARSLWNNSAVKVASLIPERMRLPSAALGVMAVIIVGAMASEEVGDNTRANRAVSLFGLLVFIFVLWATSRNRSKIRWHTVIVGELVQFIIALFVLRTKAGFDIFNFISQMCRDLLGFANKGVVFLTADSVTKLGWFLTGVIPPIIFFVAFVQLLYYWYVGIVRQVSRVLTRFQGRAAMVHLQIRSLFLLGSPCVRSGSGCRSSIAIHRPGRICHADQAICRLFDTSRTPSDNVFGLCNYCW